MGYAVYSWAAPVEKMTSHLYSTRIQMGMAENYPRNIIDAFGGIRPMARKTGYAAATISSWLMRGSIHDEHKPELLRAARSHGIALSEVDFFPEQSVGSSPS